MISAVLTCHSLHVAINVCIINCSFVHLWLIKLYWHVLIYTLCWGVICRWSTFDWKAILLILYISYKPLRVTYSNADFSSLCQLRLSSFHVQEILILLESTQRVQTSNNAEHTMHLLVMLNSTKLVAMYYLV